MIISHKHKFIFVHCRKAAGSSIKVALSSILGDEDIVIGSANEILNAGLNLTNRARRDAKTLKGGACYLAAIVAGRGTGRALNVAIKSRYSTLLGNNPAHPSALLISNTFPDEWREYYKFAVTRNPFERVVSDYFWRLRLSRNKDIPFLDYLNDVADGSNKTGLVHRGATRNWDMISIKNEIVLDKVARFENLAEDLSLIANHIGVPNLNLGRKMKVGSPKNYREFYGEKELQIMRKAFAHEIDYFGYNLTGR